MAFKNSASTSKLELYIWIIASVWTITIALSLGWNLVVANGHALELLTIQARMVYEKDLIYRRWNSEHGGVYVPVTEKTPPNPYLFDLVPERDILTASGKKLTLVNPAYMIRQVNELLAEKNEIHGHITSLNPIRPENMADPWEAKALQAFGKGETEVISIEKIDGQDYLRLMRPFITEKGCLKCHEKQGYKEGDIRGGISISVPAAPLMKTEKKFKIIMIWRHLVLLLLGIGGIIIGASRLIKSDRERIKVEEEIAEQKEFLQSILESLTHPLYVINADDYTIQMANPAARKDGITEKTTCYAYTHKRDKPCSGEHVCPLEKVKSTKKEVVVEHIHYDKDGNQREVEVHGYPIFDKAGNVVQMIEYSLDIGIRKEVERKEKEVAALKDKFTAMVTHEIRTPLTIIKGQIDLLREGIAGPVSDKQKDLLDRALKGLVRLNNLTTDILDIEKMKAGKMQLFYGENDMNELVEKIYQDAKASVEEKGLQLTRSLGNNIPKFNFDKNRIEQVILNLLNNASKFTEKGQISIEVKKIDNAVQVSVKDTGPGIHKESLGKLFGEFEQVGGEKKGGTGLGLSIAKDIVELHKGKIWVESEFGKGTVFYFTLPAV